MPFSWFTGDEVYGNEAQAAGVSIILNQAVLELLTYSTAGTRLVTTGEWIASNLRGEGIDPIIPPYCVELSALAKQHNLIHSPHVLVEIRNSLVHVNAIVRPASV